MAEPVKIAVIGGGVSGSSFIYGMRDQVAAGRVAISLFEHGRTPGGRASTRKTRERADLIYLMINHGSPEFYASTASFQSICKGLADEGAIALISTGKKPTDYFGTITSNGSFVPDAARGAPSYYGGKDGMATFSEALQRGGDLVSPPLALAHYNTCLLYTSPSPRDLSTSRMPSSA